MTRGDQRDRDRQKALKKQQEKLKSQGKTGDPLARNAADKDALQAKVARKQEEKKKSEEEAARLASTKKVEPKKNKEKIETEGLDDLLNAGLAKVKSKK